jgi:hypothetical protein
LPVEETGSAQTAMHARIDTVVGTYADELGLETSYISYCRTKMELETSLYPTNGNIPFGIDYRNIPDAETLDYVIRSREAYETNYLRLCLADARATLNSALAAPPTSPE